jgi:hypothetical protein
MKNRCKKNCKKCDVGICFGILKTTIPNTRCSVVSMCDVCFQNEKQLTKQAHNSIIHFVVSYSELWSKLMAVRVQIIKPAGNILLRVNSDMTSPYMDLK